MHHFSPNGGEPFRRLLWIVLDDPLLVSRPGQARVDLLRLGMEDALHVFAVRSEHHGQGPLCLLNSQRGNVLLKRGEQPLGERSQDTRVEVIEPDQPGKTQPR